MSVQQEIERQGSLQQEDDRDAIAEFVVEGFVVEDMHGYPGSHAAAYNSQTQQCGLGNAPAFAARLPFVEAVDNERQHVHGNEVI